MPKMKPPSPAIVKRVQTLASLAADLHHGKHFNITRLTILKSLCSAPDATAKFAVCIAKLAQRQFEARSGNKKPEYKQLITRAIPAMNRFLKSPTDTTEAKLWELRDDAKQAQNKFEHQRWGSVRIIECWELLIVETAMECLLYPSHSSILGYQLARKYAEKYDLHFGTGLIPKSASMMDEIADFWGRHFLGRGWRKKVEG
jgi:hypothetical protein